MALLGYCFSDECADEFQQLIKTQCENINSTCRFHDFNEKCIATVDECSKGNGDPNFCQHIIPSTFPQKKCKYYTNSSCLLEDTVCSDFNNGIAGITFDRLKNRSLCDGFKASDDKKCFLDNDRTCKEFFVSCGDATSSCITNLISYTNRCKLDGSGNCVSSEKRDCDSTVENVYENEFFPAFSDLKSALNDFNIQSIINTIFKASVITASSTGIPAILMNLPNN